MTALFDEIVHLSQSEISSIANDVIKTAEAVDLVYVHDTEPGIRRIKRGSTFCYFLDNRKISSKEKLERIRKLVIPPAWENVWICVKENGHLQATGIDVKKRKQYRYHPLWNSLRNHTKFHRLYEFGSALPGMRKQLEKDLSLPGLPLEKILALVVVLMEQTNIRIGNDQYEKLYGSYGLTTLKDQHVTFPGGNLRFTFKGKKGIRHTIHVKNKRLAALVKKCRDIPGKELFQYEDEDKNHHCVDSGMVNDYIRRISGGNFTAKDFRTWSGTVHALQAFRQLGCCEALTELKRRTVQAFDIVSQHLGNTRNVCKKYYVHPLVISLYESGALEKYFSAPVKNAETLHSGLHCEEEILMRIFEKEPSKQKQEIPAKTRSKKKSS